MTEQAADGARNADDRKHDEDDKYRLRYEKGDNVYFGVDNACACPRWKRLMGVERTL